MKYNAITVIGATGQQGGSIVRFLSATYPRLSIRAVSRNIHSAAATALTTLGPNISLVQADLGDKASLVTAFKGSDAIYLVTDYWNTQNNSVAPNLNDEIMHGFAAVDAASETEGLRLFMFGTLFNFASLSNVKWTNIYHFNTKAAINAYIQSKPELWNKTTLIYTPIYYENYLTFDQPFFPLLGGPKPVKTPNGTHWKAMYPQGGVANLPMVRIEDLGMAVGAILEQPERFFKKFALLVGEYHTAESLVSQWAEGVGVEATVETVGYEEFKARAIELGAAEFMALEIWEQMRCLEDVGPNIQDEAHLDTVDLRDIIQLATWKDWVSQQNWERFLAVDNKSSRST